MTKVRILCGGTGTQSLYWLADECVNDEWKVVEFDTVEEAIKFLRIDGADWKSKFHRVTVVTLHKSFIAEEKKTITILEKEE